MHTQNLIARFFGMNWIGPDPFGAPLVIVGEEAEGNPFRFSTKYSDGESGLLYYGYRFYSPSLGRWPNRDPLGEITGDTLLVFVFNAPPWIYDDLGGKPRGGGKIPPGNRPPDPGLKPLPGPKVPGGSNPADPLPGGKCAAAGELLNKAKRAWWSNEQKQTAKGLEKCAEQGSSRPKGCACCVMTISATLADAGWGLSFDWELLNAYVVEQPCSELPEFPSASIGPPCVTYIDKREPM